MFSADGAALYRSHCYFCHGYNGDAATLAAEFMHPKPADFTQLDGERIGRARMLASVRDGRPGTAMRAFKGRLSSVQIAAVVDYVRGTIMTGKHRREYYHSAENGWAGHDRYQDAFPFATGQVPLDTPWEMLTAAQRDGKRLYLSACISCHDRGRVMQDGAIWQAQAVSFPRPPAMPTGPLQALQQVDAVSGASPYARHDQPVKKNNLTALQREGETLFLNNCAFCHAADGSGKNWIGSFLEPRPRDLTALRHADGLAEKIADGVPGTSMPAWKTVLNARQLQALQAYIRGGL